MNKYKERGYGGGLLRFLYLLVSGKFKKFQMLHPWSPICSDIWYKDVVPILKSSGFKSIGLLSFCWGAYPAMHVSGESGIDVRGSVMFHPSFDKCSDNFREDKNYIIERAGKVKTYVISTSMEPESWKPGGEVNVIMSEKNNETIFREVNHKHGFMTRGDMQNDLVMAEDIGNFVKEVIEFLK